MTELHVLRVFLGPDGGGGNPLGVFLDGGAITPDRRQVVAHELGFSETVFIDEVGGAEARIAIFTPAAELPFAGHPTVGTSWCCDRSAAMSASRRSRPGMSWRGPTTSAHDRPGLRGSPMIDPRRFATPADADAWRPGPG
jgi:hypothetical protein